MDSSTWQLSEAVMIKTSILTVVCSLGLALPLGVEMPSPPKSPPPAAPAKQAANLRLAELLLFFPTKFPDGNWQPPNLQYEDVWFQAADGTRLHGWYCPCKNARAVLLYAHGNARNLSYFAPLLRYYQQDLRITTLIFDYRGYGRSAGQPTIDGILQDARAARAELARRAGVREPAVVLLGRSLGGAVVVQLAAELPPRGLILESTFSSFREVAAHHAGEMAALVPPDKLDSVARLATYPGPLLQSHGDADRTIPFAQGLKLFDAARVARAKEFFKIPGGEHNQRPPAEYYQKLTRFLDKLPPG